MQKSKCFVNFNKVLNILTVNVQNINLHLIFCFIMLWLLKNNILGVIILTYDILEYL